MGNEQVDRLIFDVCALLFADPTERLITLMELEKDGVELYCFGDISRAMLMNALMQTAMLSYFDDIFYEEKLPLLDSSVLRMLSNSYWVRFPYQVHYKSLSQIVGKRRLHNPFLLLQGLYLDHASQEEIQATGEVPPEQGEPSNQESKE